MTVIDLIQYLETFPPEAEVKLQRDIGEFDPVIVWNSLKTEQIKLVDEDVRIG